MKQFFTLAAILIGLVLIVSSCIVPTASGGEGPTPTPIPTPIPPPAWHQVGSAGFSAGQANYASLAFTTGGVPYVAYQDVANSNKASVMVYNGSSWTQVGTAGFGIGVANHTTLSITATGIPQLVSTGDYLHFVSGAWTSVSATGISQPSMCFAFNPSFYPSAAYITLGTDKPSVQEFNGTVWALVGAADFTTSPTCDFISQAYATNGVHFVAFMNGGLDVRKFNGTSWVQIGSSAISTGVKNCTAIALNASDVPYVACNDPGQSLKANVFKFNGTAWVQVGAADFSAGSANKLTLVISAGGTPYLSYIDGGNGNKLTVMKFDGSAWVAVGSAGFSPGAVDYPVLALSPAGTPYVAFQDGANGNKISVMKFE